MFDRQGQDLKNLRGDQRIFIETGSETGGGIEAALLAGFEQVYSIELDPKFYHQCEQRFAGDDRVNLILGDSLVELPKLLEIMSEPFFLWLDAHWSMEGYKGEMMHDFLPKELDVLASLKHKFKGCVLAIDDMDFYIYDSRYKSFCEGCIAKVAALNEEWTVDYHKVSTTEQMFLVGR